MVDREVIVRDMLRDDHRRGPSGRLNSITCCEKACGSLVKVGLPVSFSSHPICPLLDVPLARRSDRTTPE